MEQGIRIIVLLWLLLSAVPSLQSQSVGDIDTLSQWRVDSYLANSYGVVYYHFKYYIDGDTLIDSNNYLKAYKSGYSFEWESGGYITDTFYFDHEFARPLRENDNKWYTIDNNLGNDQLLYDFDLNIGDTLESFAGSVIIANVDSIIIDGVYKRRLHCDAAGWGAEYIIEDVGANTGLFESLYFFENGSTLNCFAIDYLPLWINPDGGECDLSVTIPEFENSIEISTYPNPFTTSTAIEFALNAKSKFQISIFNTIGEMVYQYEETCNQGTHKVSWSPGPLPSGLYYGVLRGEEGVSVVKMVKQ